MRIRKGHILQFVKGIRAMYPKTKKRKKTIKQILAEKKKMRKHPRPSQKRKHKIRPGKPIVVNQTS